MGLVELLKRPEGKTLEFKRDLFTPEGALKTTLAFSNTPAWRCFPLWRTGAATSIPAETDQAILETLAVGAGRLTSEIAEAVHLTPRATRTRLVGRGLMREIGTGPQDPKRRYF